jgi:cytochrome c
MDLSLLASAGLPDLPNGLAVHRRPNRGHLRRGRAPALLRGRGAAARAVPERTPARRARRRTPGTVAAAAVDGTSGCSRPTRSSTRRDRGRSGPGLGAGACGRHALRGRRERRHPPLFAPRTVRGIGGGGGSPHEDHDDGSRGAEVWRACAVCHSLDPGDHSRPGPSLHGIFGRPIASAEGYAFSPALRTLDIVWTPAHGGRALRGRPRGLHARLADARPARGRPGRPAGAGRVPPTPETGPIGQLALSARWNWPYRPVPAVHLIAPLHGP